MRNSEPLAVCIPAGDLQHTLYMNSPEDVVELSEKADLATDDMMDPTAVATSVFLPKVCASPGPCILLWPCQHLLRHACPLMRLHPAVDARLKGVSETPGVMQAQILRFTPDSVPRTRCHAISAKAGELRSTVSQGLQGLSPEELQARQLRAAAAAAALGTAAGTAPAGATGNAGELSF